MCGKNKGVYYGKGKMKTQEKSYLKILSTFFVVLLLVASGLYMKINLGYFEKQPTQVKGIADILKTSPIPTVLPIVKARVENVAVKDPMVNCDFKYLPDKEMKQSDCSKSFECQINDKWYIYTSKDKCSQDQKGSTTNYVPTQAKLNNTNSYNFYTSPPNITCIVDYPCTGNSYTYQVDQATCNFMKTGAASTCSTSDAIKKMNELSNPSYVLPTLKPIDGTITFDPPKPTPIVPVGYGYSN